MKRVLILAGGTGGHVFPGLAVAASLRDHGVEVHWLGTEAGLEARVVPEAHIPIHHIAISGLRGKGIKALLQSPFKMARALLQAKSIIQKINPDVVIGMGGFVSGPGGMASWLLRKPLVIHEQNARAGLTNRLLARVASKVLAGFPGAFQKNKNVQVVGNPVRSEIENLPNPTSRFNSPHTKLRLLILGGSLGAQGINAIVPRALASMPEADRPEVIHQAGEKHIEATKKCYESMQVQANIVPFVKDMAEVYSWADVVLCRAGALTVSELCAVGLGAVLVPFPFAVDDHQTANAYFMVNHQAAICVQQSDLTETRLAELINEFSQSPKKVIAMAQSAYQLRNVAVAGRIVEICKEICQ